jgi:predicted peptidase
MRKDLLMALGGLFSVRRGAGAGRIENRSVRTGSGIFTYQVYAPQATGENNLPLITFLHGIRERGTGGFVPVEGAVGMLVRQYLRQVPAIILLPQCRPGSYWSDSVMEQMVAGALDETVSEFGADENRLYLSGVSMGGYGVWSLAMRHPQKFAALVSICGGSPVTAGDRFTPIAQKVGKTPAWLFHGAQDRVVQVSESRQIVAALRAHQGNVRYSEYAGVGHNVWLNVAGDKELMPWLLAQRRGG